ncbi:hypothetical protein M2232_002815 [Bradyrhizobium japonicum]|nr:hypothetical protein [Bradyrhizobium japonicum]MCW2343897.1 hypothetical protein [Bradyrhizobium japonicum]
MDCDVVSDLSRKTSGECDPNATRRSAATTRDASRASRYDKCTRMAERSRAPTHTERVSPPSTRIFWPVM